MKPCAKNQKFLSLLAVNALEGGHTEELRAHVEICPGCRRYLEEVADVARRLKASSSSTPEVEAPPNFHRNLARRIEAETQPGPLAAAWMFVRSGGLNWHRVMPVASIVLGVFMVILALGLQWGRQTILPRAVQPVVSTAATAKDLPPTFGSYRMLADRSLDALNQELTKEAQVGSTGAPVQTALRMGWATTAD